MFRLLAVVSTVLAVAACADSDLGGRLVVRSDMNTDPTCATASADGELCVAGDIETNANLDVAGTSTLTGAITATGDIDANGGVGALDFSSDGASSITVADNDSTALVVGSTGLLNLLTLDTGDSTETVIVTGTTTVDAFHVDTGTAIFDEGVDMATAATHLETIRFCGNGFNGATAHFMGPVLLDDTEADLAFGGAGCDALDNATEGTADAPWHTSFAFKPVAMVCVGRCTGTSAANDAAVYQLRDDTADVTGMTCTATAWSGDDNPQQCTVRDATPATVAAGSAIAIEITGTDDVCNDAGDDFECLLYITF